MAAAGSLCVQLIKKIVGPFFENILRTVPVEFSTGMDVPLFSTKLAYKQPAGTVCTGTDCTCHSEAEV